MKDKINNLKGKRILFPLLIAFLAVLLVGGVATAATVYTVSIQHKVNIVEPPPEPDYSFTVTGVDISGGTIDWGNVEKGSNVTKTVTITLTGNMPITVTPDFSGVNSNFVSMSASPPSVDLTVASSSETMTLNLTAKDSIGNTSFYTDFIASN